MSIYLVKICKSCAGDQFVAHVDECSERLYEIYQRGGGVAGAGVVERGRSVAGGVTALQRAVDARYLFEH